MTPVVRILSARDVHHLLDEDGALLAELSIDEVLAERLTEEGHGTTSAWTELEVELADDVDPALLDAVERRLRKAGVRPSAAPSKLPRALAETAPGKPRPKKVKEPSPRTAGDHVLAYVRRQVTALVELDPAVRRDLPDSVHRMRVATRRLRSAFRTYRKVLDRTVTDPAPRRAEVARRRTRGRPRPGSPRRTAPLPRRRAARHPAPGPRERPAARSPPSPGAPTHGDGSPRVLDARALPGPAGLPGRPPRRPAPAPRSRRGRLGTPCPAPCSRTTNASPPASSTPWTSRPARNATWPCTRRARPPSASATPPRPPGRRWASRPRSSPNG